MTARVAPILPSRDLAAAAAFWNRLGFATFRLDPGAYLIVARDGAELHFWLNPTLLPAANDAGAYLRPSDLDALDAEWAALGLPGAGIPRLVRAEAKPWGMREMAVVDPDGNLLRVGVPA